MCRTKSLEGVFFSRYGCSLLNFFLPVCRSPTGPLLSRQSSKNILCWGKRRLELCFHGHWFQWSLLLAAVQLPILDIELLCLLRLLVDPAVGTRFSQQSCSFIGLSPARPHTAALAPFLVLYFFHRGLCRCKSSLQVDSSGLAGCHLQPTLSVQAVG
jgi:hypothetical protein